MRARRFDEFAAAAALLTRLPFDRGGTAPPPGMIAAACWAFPLIGAGIGGLCAIAYGIAQAVGLGALPGALLAVAAGLCVTGALHEDGLADTADGFGGGRDRTEKLAIMRDSRHGTFGVLALMLSVALRAAAIGRLGDPLRVGLALIAAHAASRAALPPLMMLLDPARSDGLGATAGRPARGVAIAAGGLGAAIALAVLGPTPGAVALALAGGAVGVAAVLAQRQIGGYTGDILGFFQQIGEIAMLLAASAAAE